MSQAYLHEKLRESCQNSNIQNVRYYLEQGADVNLNMNRPTNALYSAIQTGNHKIVALLLEHGALVKEFVLQKAIEKDREYLNILLPHFLECSDENLLMGVLQAAITIGDIDLAKQAIKLGAKAELLVLSAVHNIKNIEILQLLLENGFNIHADKNMILTQWMGSTFVSGWGDNKIERYDLLTFISEYYLDKADSIEKFKSLRLPDKSLLFRIGLRLNDFSIMKFAVLIGMNKNEALNSTLHRYYAQNQGNKDTPLNYEIIQYLLDSNIKFNKVTISNAVCFKYMELLNILHRIDDLEYGYEMAYHYENNELCDYFIQKGVSKEAQNFAKMKISAIKGDMKELRQALNDGADSKTVDTSILVEVLNQNHVAVLEYFHNSGVNFDTSLNKHLNHAMNYHNAYKAITYLIEQGFDIGNVKNIPQEYKKSYPTLTDMWEKRFSDIFEYTLYLARDIHPKAEGKEKEEVLEKLAQLSSLPYVIKKSREKAQG
jgi:hypothetical protein